MNCETYSSFEGVSSDRRIVTAKIQISLRRDAAQVTTTIHYDWSLLNNRDIRDEYMLTLRNKFDALQEISETPTPNDEYENFVNAPKHNKGQKELANIYLKEQREYVQNQINKIRDSVEDRQSRIAWQMVNEVSRRKSTKS